MVIHQLALSSETPPRFSAGDLGVTVWRGSNGPLVIARREGEQCWVYLAGIASYRFPAVAPDVAPDVAPAIAPDIAPDLAVRCVAVPASGAASGLVVDSYYRVVAPLALQVYGLESLHGTALGFDGSAVLLCGSSGTGKSTLAQALTDRGANLLGDDGLVIEVGAGSGGGVLLHPLPFTLLLREPAATHFQRPTTNLGAPAALAPSVTSEAVPVRAVLCLERVAGAELSVRELAPTAGLTRLLAHAYAFTLDDEVRKRRMLAAYLRFANAVPVYLLRFPTGLERLASVATLVERIASGEGGGDGAGIGDGALNPDGADGASHG